MIKIKSVLAAAESRLVDDWRGEAKRLWSIRVALFWGAVSGLYGAWDAFQSVLPAPLFAAASVVMSVSLVGARLTKQTGGDDA